MEVAIAYDLVSDVQLDPDAPDDLLAEYDPPETIEAIEAALRANGLTTRRLGGGESLVRALLDRRPGLVFNIAEGKGTRSREAHVPAVLELLGVPYTHSDPFTMAVTLEKSAATTLVAAHAVPTPVQQMVEEPDFELEVELPVVAKPIREGSSIGIRSGSSILRDPSSVRAHVLGLLERYRQPVLLEELCPGPELTVGIVGNGRGAEPIGVMEIVPRARSLDDFLYSIDVKRNYQEEVEFRLLPGPPFLVERSLEMAVRAYSVLGCRDVARVDLRVGGDGEPKFLEMNPLPGLHPESDIVVLSRLVGIGYEELIGRIVEAARARYGI